MTQQSWLCPPAEIGADVASIDTPALLLDLDAFERNLAALPATLVGWSGRVRPHAKAHKCPEIARRQVACGAVGLCCQKVSEAEALVRGGIRDIVIVNEIVGAPKLARLARLAGEARIGVTVDDARNADDLDRAAREAGVCLDVLVELEVGLERCGVEPGPAAVALARLVADKRNLRFAGLQAYQGRAQHLRGHQERRAAAALAAQKVRATLDLLDAEGLHADTVTGGGTGTYEFEVASGVYNEIQPGSYVFLDADYVQESRRGRTAGPDVRAEPLRAHDRDEPPSGLPGRRGRGAQGAQRGLGDAAGGGRAGRAIHAGVRRTWRHRTGWLRVGCRSVRRSGWFQVTAIRR